MAHYNRFEIYIPVIFSVVTKHRNGTETRRTRALPGKLIEEFVAETINKFGGITQANPAGPAPWTGFWEKQSTTRPEEKIEVDRLTSLVSLSRIDQEKEVLDHFTDWKAKFERLLQQSVVVVQYYPV